MQIKTPKRAGFHMSASINVVRLHKSADEACKLLKTVGNRNRLLLLCRISQGEVCVSDLESALGIHQPTLSQQLAVLRKEGLVLARRDGKQIYYSLLSEAALGVMNVLYKSCCKP
jgi:ArsR family transcriptional regulator